MKSTMRFIAFMASRGYSFRSFAFSSFCPGCNADGLAHPRCQLSRILQHVCRNLVVPHRAAFPERPKRLHAKAFEVRACCVIHFEIEPLLRDEGEERALSVDSHTAKHGFGSHRHYPFQLFQDETAIAFRDSHRATSDNHHCWPRNHSSASRSCFSRYSRSSTARTFK